MKTKVLSVLFFLCLCACVPCVSAAAESVQPVFFQPTWHGDLIRNNHGGILTLETRSDTHLATKDEAIAFVRTDLSDRHPFIFGQYDCSDFAQNFQHNATEAGILCGVCVMHFERYADGSWNGHYIDVIPTSDAGLLFIDCTTGDCIAEVHSDQTYVAVPLDDPNTELTREIISEYTIVW